MSERKLILFDWDGTLSNVSKVLEYGLPLFSKEMSLSYDVKKFEVGYFDPETMDMGWGIALKDQIKMRDQWDAFLVDKTLNDNNYIAPLYNHIPEILCSLQKEYDLGIVTARDRRTLVHMMRYHQISEKMISYRSRCCAADSGYKIKPSPDAIKSFINETGHSIENTVMIGDAPADIEMANNAGIKSIAVLWGLYPEDILIKSQPTYLLQDIKDLTKAIEKVFINV